MTTRKKAKKPRRVPRSDEYRKEAVKLADTVGATEAAKKLPCVSICFGHLICN